MRFEETATESKEQNRRESCAGCIYRRDLSPHYYRYKVCHFLHDTDIPRGCPAAKCTRKKVAK